MIIIGEKINGTIPVVKKAIAERDADFIAKRAKDQVDAGADFIDVCASTAPDVEIETLRWLMEIVQNTVDIPLCIDSPDPRVIEAVLPFAKKEGIINSVSKEGNKCELLLPLIKNTKWEMVALTCDDNGIPNNLEKKITITKSIVEEADEYGITPDRIHIDPCVMALSSDGNAMINFTAEIKSIKAIYPTIKMTGAISNISFGMPVRALLNKTCIAFAIEAGLDSAVMDPMNREMMESIYASSALLGKDRHCRRYNTAFRKGVIGKK
ncbi:methyltetrahydrofolate cobalamin methyltransferase [Acetobacterium bakii]|uniref:Methyltetrahydrofolate:corrinoid methyltransferase n=1 Tax=Acetobacterium bakii TaxID=52689 RepID=A0A0L6TYZ8_9FIRM|nr:methyltetrahydrofolate cobalamin methyltransferase [Acetobacterium bakii]KNZ41489.1 methyltetrahydrofolate:corrinoid methyltransferase [Acetobacterium bakii]